MKGIIWSYTVLIFILTIISSLLFVNNYYATYDSTANANKRAIVETLQQVIDEKLSISTKEVLHLYKDRLDPNLKGQVKIEMLGYQEYPYALRIKLTNHSIPFVSVISDETVIEEEKDE